MAALALPRAVLAQTWSQCNPLTSSGCPADQALGMTINVDFTKGAVNSFVASGSPTYDSNGVSFTVARSGDAPQLASVFYIMFGRVEVTMKAAPGAGIVSSLVLQSDDLDEIDLEWLGAEPDQVQSNYFGKGQTTTYNRGQFHSVSGTQSDWIKYTIDWTQDRIIWSAGDSVLRTLTPDTAEANQYPQTPMQIKFGSWSGGDPSTNAPGTVKWAMGPTDYSKGPFSMMVQSITVSDYSTGKQYVYGDTSGSWQSIQAVGGQVNGNSGNTNNDNTPTVTASNAAGSSPTIVLSIPLGGLATDKSPATATQTGWPWVAGATPTSGTIPSGWHMNPDGKIARNAGAASDVPVQTLLVILTSHLMIGALAFAARI
ncbi:glycoside hydrolase family 16 protein [Trichoderma citrinoviride]|uniref:chitinase n=1 Tax=Trichoderma citrinoviride TaxID=58853 RepID=A0A2T4B7M4_9HYPO|nr:glycoside hydrolase family 16 protein [Trichoderma citrinoviride]PTB65332.1 glycoside hydrolase family 16 protein [Trichoderma citrinoviride]